MLPSEFFSQYSETRAASSGEKGSMLSSMMSVPEDWIQIVIGKEQRSVARFMWVCSNQAEVTSLIAPVKEHRP